MAEVTPYLTATDFQAMFRPLVTEETALATLTLKAAAIIIRRAFTDAGQTPPTVGTDDEMARLVSYQLAREALPAVSEMVGRTQYTIQTDDRIESGTLAAAADLIDFTDHHRRLLGLPLGAQPAYGGFDSGFGGDCPRNPFDVPYGVAIPSGW